MQLKVGDLVMLKDKNDFPQVPGALTALKFYQRLEAEFRGKVGIVLSILHDQTVLVLINSYRQPLNVKFLKVVSKLKEVNKI